MAGCIVGEIDSNYNTETNVYNSIFEQYERVVMQSLITSFGLDFLVKDQYGGDVDTIHNVRQIDKDKQMTYKNKRNEDAYNSRGNYNFGYYHSDPKFAAKKHNAREEWRLSGVNIKDEYTNKDVGFYGHTKSIPPDKKAELDHIISAKEIHEDRGRLLSGLDGRELANMEDNLAWTNKSLNASMQDKDIQEYIKVHSELDEDTKRRMIKKDSQARKGYNERINRSYYTSPAFFKDTVAAAGKVGVAMGLRQALGLVFSEIWFAVRAEIKQGQGDGEALFNSVANGIEKGVKNAKNKYKELWHKFIEGAIGGVLASLTTTLCNIFFSTAKNLIRIIRQSWASLVEATKILLYNPDCLPLGERFRAAAKIIATGASIIVGTMVGEMIGKTGVATIPVVGDIVQTFCGTLVSGIMSCSLLYILDRNSIVNKIVEVLNLIPTVENSIIYYKRQAQLLDEYCAKLMCIDLVTLKKETEFYRGNVLILEKVKSQKELNFALNAIYKQCGLVLPIGNHLDMNSFMLDKNSKLRYC